MKEKKPEKAPSGGSGGGPTGDGESLEAIRKKADDIFADIGDIVNKSVSENPAEFLQRARQSGGQ